MNAINNKNLFEFIQKATIEDEIHKTNCVYDIIHFDGVNIFDIKEELTNCLILLNAGLNQNMQLNTGMIKIIIDLVLNDFNGLTIVGFFRCIRKGLKGDYGQTYQMNVMTVTNWIQQYLSVDGYMSRIDELRRKHYQNKNAELRSMLEGDMIEVMKSALKLTEPKPKKYQPKQIHLYQFKQVIKLFTNEEIEKALEDWSKRQRPQYLEILNQEKESRKDKHSN